jgi:cytochrome P450
MRSDMGGGDVFIEGFFEMREVLRGDLFVPDGIHPRTPLFDSTLLLLTDDEHRHRRRLEMQLFGRAGIRALNRDVLGPNIEDALRDVMPEGAGATVCVDLVPLLKVTMYRLAAAVTGIDVDDAPDVVRLLISLQERFAQGGSVTYDSDHVGARLADALEARDEFRVRFFEPSLARRRALVQASGDGPASTDVLTVLACDERGLDEATMLAEAMFYFAASTGNTARMVPHCLSDIWAWQSTEPTQRTSLNSTLFHLAAAETSRLHPSSPKIYRRASCDITLSSGRVTLFALDVQPDPTRPAHLMSVDRYEYYDSFPVQLSPPRPNA